MVETKIPAVEIESASRHKRQDGCVTLRGERIRMNQISNQSKEDRGISGSMLQYSSSAQIGREITMRTPYLS